MQLHTFNRVRFLFTLGVTLIAALVLISQHFDQGVAAHYLFQNPELPRLSNWWALVILPVLSWLCLGFVLKRLSNSAGNLQPQVKQVFISFFIAVIYGLAISIFFSLGISTGASGLFFAIPFLAIFFKVYRGEYVLGFVIGMSAAFGVVLPTLFALVMALIAWLMHLLASFCKSKLFKANA